VLNEADNLPALHEHLTAALEKLGHDWEVVLANDGSTDGSAEVLDRIAAADKRFKVVHLRRNFGQTAALMAALDHSSGDIIIMMDADLQNDASDIVHLLAKLGEGYDVVSGWRRERRATEWGRGSQSSRCTSADPPLRGKRSDRAGLHANHRRARAMGTSASMARCIATSRSMPAGRGAGDRAAGRPPPRLQPVEIRLLAHPQVALDLLVIFFFDKALDRPMQFFRQDRALFPGRGVLAGLYAVWLRFAEDTSFIKTPLPLLVVLLTVTALLCIFFGVIAEIQMRTYYEGRGKRAYIVRKTINID
jgi:glycosyltransferase involved in cell wall biosynthesis